MKKIIVFIAAAASLLCTGQAAAQTNLQIQYDFGSYLIHFT